MVVSVAVALLMRCAAALAVLVSSASRLNFLFASCSFWMSGISTAGGISSRDLYALFAVSISPLMRFSRWWAVLKTVMSGRFACCVLFVARACCAALAAVLVLLMRVRRC